MKRIFMSCVFFVLLFSNICFADSYTRQISNLGAERFVQEYNSATYIEHGKINYFVTPDYATPSNWKGMWPYDLWKTISVDSKYRLEITVNKQGYVTKAEIICAYQSDVKNAVRMIVQMLNTSSILSRSQIDYLIKSVKSHRGSNNKFYYRGDVVVDNKLAVVFYTADGSSSVSVLGISPYD